MNLYADLATLKSASWLNITSTEYDTGFVKYLDMASRAIDNYTHRRYYTEIQTWEFDGQASPFFLPDTLSITTLKTDEDGDGTFENSYTEGTDYYLYPLNHWPKTRAVIAPNGSYGGFASGMRKAVEIDGLFGYGDGESSSPYLTSGDAVGDDPLSSSATSITVADEGNFAVGQTIGIQDEQCYISAIATTTLTVARAQNGTTAASHVITTVIYIYQYPSPIVQATLIQAMRWWKRRESAFQDVVRSSESMGEIVVYKGMDPDIELVIKTYKRRSVT